MVLLVYTDSYSSYPIEVHGVRKLVPRFTADQDEHLIANVARNSSAEHSKECRHSLGKERGRDTIVTNAGGSHISRKTAWGYKHCVVEWQPV